MISLRLTLVLLALTVCTTASWAGSSVWIVRSGSDAVYVGGTLHVLRSSDYPLPAEFDTAYAGADRVFFETDIGRLRDPEVQQMMRQRLLYDDGRTLPRVLSADVYGALEQYAKARGVSLSRFDTSPPIMVLLAMLALELERVGASAEGVDEYFYGRALADGKPVGSLESVERQMDVLQRVGEGQENELVMHSLAELHETGAMIEQAVGAWRVGNTGRLATLLLDRMQQHPAIYDGLIVERNHDWMAKVERLFHEPGHELVLVGVAHLVGRDGLLSELEQAGYEVRQLETGGAAWGD